MAILPRSWAVIIANVLTPLAVLVFSSGFFPYKPLIPGLARFEDGGNYTATPKAFDKVIFMVIDALRSLIRSGAALPFTAYASSPTVTMPRLKAITTGSKPSFLDVILNIAESDTSSTLAYQDTWLAQLKANGGQLVMYGDDTWLKLFPGMFERADAGSGSQRIDVLLSNSRQILRKMNEMFPNRSFDINSMDIACDSGPLVGVDLALCAWFRVNILLQNSGGADKNDLYPELESALFVFLKQAQEVISSAASDYDLRNLLLGLAITSFVVLLPLPTIYTLLCKSGCAGAFFALCLLGYGGMMFASSYVEEEQQFWNWMFTAWASLSPPSIKALAAMLCHNGIERILLEAVICGIRFP
ncbi:sulfatase [Aspergillus luchuensis]|uniref:GPI ethanolamine phosphate transferase 2 n=1 Tax=Aspergillus kawachii TaxID=1069201 RepID=A0A146G104_ASPKA|nr:sulfatase [Aspergillus luchuensis]